MIWELSDGTRVHLGGRVEGESFLAKFLRRDMSKGPKGPLVYPDAMPSPGVTLDVNDPWHVNSLVTDVARCRGVAVVSAPHVEPIPGPPAKVDDSDGPRVY